MHTQKSLARDGFVATARRGAAFLTRRARGGAPRLDRAFDDARGVETAVPSEVPAADVVGPNWLSGVAYQPLPGSFDFGAVLADRGLRYEELTFLDLGAGKGRALLLAAALPFRSIVGVEYSASLVEVARENIDWVGDPRLSVVCADAAAYELPPEPLVIFLYNPFGDKVMRGVIRNVGESIARTPRRVVVVYFTPVWHSLWIDAGFVPFVAEHSGAAIYDSAAPG